MLLFDGHTVFCICCVRCWFMYHWIATLGLKIHHSFLSPICRVIEYHVDGFRFDLTSILCRGTDGSPLNAPPLIRVKFFMHLHIYCYRKECNTWWFFENYGDSKGRCGVVAIFSKRKKKILCDISNRFSILSWTLS